MATVSNEVFQDQLVLRRKKLLAISPAAERSVEVAVLLKEIDYALDRLQKGTFGICEECKGGIEADALVADPTLRICLDHFTAAQRRSLEHDLELAHQIQHRLLPENGLHLHGWDVRYHYQPANLVSGDYCDLIFPQDARDETIFLVGDVSGKGVAAAMLMTQLHAMFRTLGGLSLPLNRLLASANQVLAQSTLSGQFATLVAGRANARGSIEIAGAGHVPALLVTDRGVTSVPASGLPLGISPVAQYPSQSFRLNPGDTLVLYSDGLSEAENPEGEQYGQNQFNTFLTANRSSSAEQLLSGCLSDLHAFRGDEKLADDLTLMVVRRSPANA